MSRFRQLVESLENPADIVKLVEDASGPIGPDRRDDITSPEEAADAFIQLAMEYASKNGYINYDDASGAIGAAYINQFADAIRSQSPMGIAELQDMAYKNRAQYDQEGARIDAGGSFGIFDSIHRALTAVATDQLPPPTPMMQDDAQRR